MTSEPEIDSRAREMADACRVLVTVSRTWNNPATIWVRLHAIRREAEASGQRIVIVHGDGESDQVAKLFGLLYGAEHSYPADWHGPCTATCHHGPRRTRRNGADYCQAAGAARNRLMADSGVHQVEAFLAACDQKTCTDPTPHHSHGAGGTAAYAKRKGITVNPHYLPGDGNG